jgi:hydrogenase maturation protease
MNLESVEKIAEAVLYEGYMLYPYRASAVKNQQRWNFGVLTPRAFSEQENGSDRWIMQTQCLLQAGADTQLNIEVRFLQIVNRSIGKLASPLQDWPWAGAPQFEFVDRLAAGERVFTPWQEAIERKVTVPALHPGAHSTHRNSLFQFRARRRMEPIRDPDGAITGVMVRDREALSGSVEIDLERRRDGLFRVTVRILNLSAYETSRPESRADALMHSLVSAHTILGVTGGEFVSMLDPAQEVSDLAAECVNIGTWPVLVGEKGARDVMLSSPIILYDYPEIAPESPGSLFDGTEIDEILSLRILTLTEDEKLEMRQSDERGRQILERTESMPPEQFMKLHGVLRGLRPRAAEAQ